MGLLVVLTTTIPCLLPQFSVGHYARARIPNQAAALSFTLFALQVLSCDTLESQLHDAEVQYLEATVVVDLDKKQVGSYE